MPQRTKLASRLAMAAAMALASSAIGGCATASTPPATPPAPPPPASLASATLLSPDGATKATATLVSVNGKLELRIAAEGLTPGTHGVHLHTTGACTAPNFASAGGHLNPHARMHGTDNPMGSHLGDLPNLMIDDSGKGSLTATLQDTAAEGEPQLFDADGTAIVIHAAADDYKTDPSGNSGGRIACGVLTRG